MIIGFFAFLGTGELFMLRPGCIVIADDGFEAVITLTDTEVWLVAKILTWTESCWAAHCNLGLKN